MTSRTRVLGVPMGPFVALVLTSASPALAFDVPGDTQAFPCRPTIACSADLVAPGSFELEAGFIYRSLAASEKQYTVPFLAKLTVAKWLQLQLGSSGYTSLQGTSSSSYFDNVTLGAKFHAIDQSKWVPSVSVSAAASVPTGAALGYAQYDDVLLTFYASKDFGRVHVDFNAGYNRLGVNSTPVGQGWTALSLSTNLPKGFGVVVENYYFSDATPAASRDAGGLVALTYNPVPWLVLDAGGDVGYVTATRNFSLFGGMTIVPFRVWTPE